MRGLYYILRALIPLILFLILYGIRNVLSKIHEDRRIKNSVEEVRTMTSEFSYIEIKGKRYYLKSDYTVMVDKNE